MLKVGDKVISNHFYIYYIDIKSRDSHHSSCLICMLNAYENYKSNNKIKGKVLI